MRQELTTKEKEQGRRIVSAWRAVKTINQRADKRLAGTGPLGETLVFIRRWVQPIVFDLSMGGIITLQGSHKDEQTQKALDAEVWRVFKDSATDQLDFRFFRATDDAVEIVTVYAVEHPHSWRWSERDRAICGQIYGSIRSVDVLIDDVEKASRLELEFLRHDHAEACKEVRLMTADERKERVEKIKSYPPEYWHEGPHKPGRYPQLSWEDERRHEAKGKARDAEDRHARLCGLWTVYVSQVRRGAGRDGRAERTFVRRAGEDAPDLVTEITTTIEAWDRVNNHKEEVN